MALVNPSINFNGNCEEAFSFYQSIFGGEFTKIVRFKDLSSNLESPINESEAEKIMYIALDIGKGSMLIGNDVPKFMGTVNERENRSKIFVSTFSKEEANLIFNKLSKEGEIEVSMEDGPWGSYFGMFRDRYGVEWMIDFNPEQNKIF